MGDCLELQNYSGLFFPKEKGGFKNRGRVAGQKRVPLKCPAPFNKQRRYYVRNSGIR